MMLVILLSLKRMESLQNGLQPHSRATLFVSIRAVSLASSQYLRWLGVNGPERIDVNVNSVGTKDLSHFTSFLVAVNVLLGSYFAPFKVYSLISTMTHLRERQYVLRFHCCTTFMYSTLMCSKQKPLSLLHKSVIEFGSFSFCT